MYATLKGNPELPAWYRPGKPGKPGKLNEEYSRADGILERGRTNATQKGYIIMTYSGPYYILTDR